MTGSINQIQMLYQPEEDRILFRVNTTTNQQYRFWITRRFSTLLIKVLGDHAASDPDVSTQSSMEAKQAVQSFKQEQAMRNADFKKPFDEGHSEFPLGDQIKLAFRLTCNVSDSILSLGIHPKEGEGITMHIDRALNTSLTQLLLAAIRKADWNLGKTSIPVTATADKPIIN